MDKNASKEQSGSKNSRSSRNNQVNKPISIDQPKNKTNDGIQMFKLSSKSQMKHRAYRNNSKKTSNNGL